MLRRSASFVVAHQPPVDAIGTSRRIATLPRCIARSMVASVAFCVASLDCHAQTPVPIEVTTTRSSPGQPVTISWKLTNLTAKTIEGNLVASFNGIGLTTQRAINATSLAPGKDLSGSYDLLPSPGWNQFTVQMIYTHNVVVPGAGTFKPPTQLSQDSPAPKTSTSATHTVAVETAVAQGNVAFNASPSSAAVSFPLTAEQRMKLLKDYSPLLLYSFDHKSDELDAPIDVVSFAQASTLVGTNLKLNLTQNGGAILDPFGNGTAAGTITWDKPLPVKFNIEPPPAVRVGLNWTNVVNTQNQGKDIGLYGRALLIDLNRFRDDADTTLKQRLQSRYRCSDGTCTAQVIKLEFWQFFGFSRDYYGNSLDGLGSAIESEVNHDGDWCSVQLYVDAAWWQSGRPDRAILAVYHYLHGNQAGFDMALVRGSPTNLTVPDRSGGENGTTYPAIQLGGPNSNQTPYFSIKAKGVWLPVGGPNMVTQLAHAQNNVLQLAADTAAGDSSSSPASFRHPVVYVEWGGHEFWPTPNWSIYGASKHNGSGQYSYFGDEFTDLGPDLPALSTATELDVNLVRYFAGWWGAPSNGGPPQGPPLHLEWYWDPQVTPANLLFQIDNTKRPY